MRNLSKNSLKKLARPGSRQPGYASYYTNYHFFNMGGARAWVQSKGQINNLNGDGLKKYLTPAQRLVWKDYVRK